MLTQDQGLEGAHNWKLRPDVDYKLCFPVEIITTNLMPDLVLWSASLKLIDIVVFMVPWESVTEEAHKRKILRYTELVANI